MRVFFVAILGLSLVLVSVAPALAERDSIIRVAGWGNDAAGCGSESSPCKTIQYALDHVEAGQEIRVAEGVYTYDSNLRACSDLLGAPAVVCAHNPVFSLLGGYSMDNWEVSNPVAHPTIIDGQGAYRGVFMWGTGTTNVRIAGFTIRNGLGRGIDTRTGNDSFFGYGGGMFIDLGYPPDQSKRVELANLVFKNNKAWGEDNTPYGGSGAGGGLSLRSVINAKVENLWFEGNLAQGGNSAQRGGWGIGGGMYVSYSTLTMTDVTTINNIARAGNSSGTGVYDGEGSDGLGGGVATHGYALTLINFRAEGNKAIGGNTAGTGGAAVAGGILGETATLTIVDGDIRNNEAIGGSGTSGGLAGGGGIDVHAASLYLERTQIIANRVKAGSTTGNGASGQPGGGGIYAVDFPGNGEINIKNSVIADNTVQHGDVGNTSAGGGGGGLWLQGYETYMSHVTVRGNSLLTAGMLGNAILAIEFVCAHGTTLHFDYGIIADHQKDPLGLGAVFINNNNSAYFNRTLWVGNYMDSNAGKPSPIPGTIVNNNPVYPTWAGFVSPGYPDYDYHLRADSPARNQAIGSTELGDMDGETRALCGVPDIGADEYCAPPLALLNPLPGDSTLTITWVPNQEVASSVSRYYVTVSCPPGANSPAGGTCGEPFDVGSRTSYVLQGLTNGETYQIAIEARNSAGAVIATSNSVAAVPLDLDFQGYLPLILNRH